MSDQHVVKITEIEPGAIRAFEIEGRMIAVGNLEGTFYAFEDACPHEGCSLEEDGELEEGIVTCMCHFSEFDLDSGEVLGGPSRDPLTVYPVHREGDDLEIGVD